MELNSEYSLQIILATYPLKKRNDFVKKVTDEIIKDFKDNYFDKNEIEGYYEPSVFHLFGSFDVAFISCVENYKFVQKALIPKVIAHSADNLMHPGSYQILTGVLLYSNINDVKKEISNLHTSKYIFISNLKFNTGFSIGNGLAYHEYVISIIKNYIEKEKGINITIIQSFSWSDLVLIITGDNLKKLSEFMTTIRNSKIPSALSSDSIHSILDSANLSNYKECHLLSDTLSYVGVNYLGFDNFDFAEFTEMDGTIMPPKIQVEWNAKPSHLSNILEAINTTETKEILKHDNIKFITGKTDYLIDNIYDLRLSQSIFKIAKLDNTISDYLRKQKTRILFKPEELTPSCRIELPKRFIDQLVFSDSTLGRFNSILKSIKVSRHIREKILKIFTNYNNGISDSILFTYFIDLSFFINRLANIILECEKTLHSLFENPNFKNGIRHLTVKESEDLFQMIINIFEEGHHVRMLNSYTYEEASDFDLDLNSSIQTLLTIFNSLVYELSDKMLVGKEKFTPIVSFNLKNTVGNYYSVNFGLHELLSPEFIFFTISKEIGNVLFINDSNVVMEQMFAKLEGSYKSVFTDKETLGEADASYMTEFIEQKSLSYDYLVLEILRLKFFYASDLELFNYWSWGYNLHNSSMYGILGVLDEDHFKKELFRIMFANIILDEEGSTDNIDSLKLPILELDNYWFRHYKRLRNIFSKLNSSNSFIHFVKDCETVINGQMMRMSDTFFTNEEKVEIDRKIGRNRRNGQSIRNSEFCSLLIRLSETYLKELEVKDFHISYFDKEIKKNPFRFSIVLMYSYNKLLFFKNNKDLSILKRDWKDGKPLRASKTNSFFSFDTFGGIYFENAAKSKEYFILRNRILMLLNHFSLLTKKNEIIEISKSKQFLDQKIYG